MRSHHLHQLRVMDIGLLNGTHALLRLSVANIPSSSVEGSPLGLAYEIQIRVLIDGVIPSISLLGRFHPFRAAGYFQIHGLITKAIPCPIR